MKVEFISSQTSAIPVLWGRKSSHSSETLVKHLITPQLCCWQDQLLLLLQFRKASRLFFFFWIEWVNGNVQGTITSSEVASQQCVLASITWCWERLREAAELEMFLAGNRQLLVWLTCKLPLGLAGSPWLGIRICCDVFSQCVPSPELVPQADLQGQNCCCLASLSFPSSFTVQCSIIIFSCLQREVFNKGLSGSSVQ